MNKMNVKDIIKNTKTFVFNTCIGRDETHGYDHMNKVYKNSKVIFNKLYGDNTSQEYTELYVLTTCSALLHDVYDHKYDHDGKLKQIFDNFIVENFSEKNAKNIENVIDNVSYSKQNKAMMNGTFKGFDKILTPDECIARNIVSDADKIEAIGKEGIIRCEQFGRELYPGISEELLKEKVIEHAKEKLLRLYPKFIITEPGKEIAKPLHDEMLQYIANY